MRIPGMALGMALGIAAFPAAAQKKLYNTA
jgi:hypothetical protein